MLFLDAWSLQHIASSFLLILNDARKKFDSDKYLTNNNPISLLSSVSSFAKMMLPACFSDEIPNYQPDK